MARPRPTSDKMLKIARRRDAALRWHHACPLTMRHSNWSHPWLTPNRPQIDKVLGWTPQAAGRGLFITGATGLGKTRSFWSLLRRLMAHESREVEVYTAASFFRQLQEEVRYGRDESARWIKRRAEVPILAIDDLGQQAVTTTRAEWSEAAFFDLIDQRMGKKRPMLITTNLTVNDFTAGQEWRGDPLVRRLLEVCEVVKFTRPTK